MLNSDGTDLIVEERLVLDERPTSLALTREAHGFEGLG